MRLATRKAIAFPICALAALALLGACRAPAPKSTPATTAETVGAPPTTQTRYRVDGAASSVHILVYRAGALARLGHNHVLSTDQLAGTVVIHPHLERSQLVLDLPVNSLAVDDPAARAQEGDDFAADVPPEARAATRDNLLREEVLDGAKFPVINLRLVRVAGTHHQPIVTASISIKDTARHVEVPVRIAYELGVITARGEFAIKQTDFGMTPFSVGMGALQVRDELRVRFVIVARA